MPATPLMRLREKEKKLKDQLKTVNKKENVLEKQITKIHKLREKLK
jgi:hypothetical protein